MHPVGEWRGDGGQIAFERAGVRLMRILLIKPAPTAADFGLGPFFRTEPLGLEYVAAALGRHGHDAAVVDLRFERWPLRRLLEGLAPEVVGISCVHILDVGATARLAAEVKAFNKKTTVIVGGHAAAMYPNALVDTPAVDAIALAEGEHIMPDLCDALAGGRPLDEVPGLLYADGSGRLERTATVTPLDLESVEPPDRTTVTRYQRGYACLNYMPVWTIETARGCRFRCKFCSVWQFHQRSLRFHPIARVKDDLAATGPNVFVVDDTFFAGHDRSLTLAKALLASGIRKHWMLVQSRVDTVVEEPTLLEQWKPLARRFDIFFGFEAPTSHGLRSLHKDVDIERTVEAIAIARRLGFGVTGNFIIDPDYDEGDFEALWTFLREQQLTRVGFTILTPLPGTKFFEEMRDRLEVFDWEHYDLHHLLWQPRLSLERFFELYCETWRRTVLNLSGQKRWWHWLPDVRVRQIPRLARILLRTQRLMRPQAYLSKTGIRHR